MKQILNRLLPALLCILLLCLIPSPAQASYILAEGTCGDYLTWMLESTGTLTVSGTGPMWDYEYRTGPDHRLPPWEAYDYEITRVVLSPGVTRVGKSTFAYLGALEEIVFSDTVTEIADCGFHNCDALTAVTIPGTTKTVGAEAFGYCDVLKTVTISEGVSLLGDRAFEGCDALTQIVVPGSVATIGSNAFYGCNALIAVTLEEGIEAIGSYAFSFCTGLTSVALPESLTGLGEFAFLGCSGLTEVTIPAGVSSIGIAPFANCSSLKEIQVSPDNSHWKSEDGCLLSRDGKVFLQYPAGKTGSYEIPEGVNVISGNAFYGCTGLTGLVIPGTVSRMEANAFYNCESMTFLWLQEGIDVIGDTAFAHCDSLKNLLIPASVTEMQDTCFAYCDVLENIVFAGDAPAIAENAFSEASAAVWYPRTGEGWNSATFRNYGGSLTWNTHALHTLVSGSVTDVVLNQNIPVTLRFSGTPDSLIGMYVDACPVAQPQYTPSGDQVTLTLSTEYLATLTPGYHTVTVWFSDGCSTVSVKISAEESSSDPLPERIGGADRIDTSLGIADALKEETGRRPFPNIVVASALNFPDALAGSYLAAVKDAPILLTYDAVHSQIAQYIRQNLAETGTVYILGGTTAVSHGFEIELTSLGIPFRRVAGENRFDTNLAILHEAGFTPGQTILVCTGLDFADSLSVSATGLPVLLVGRQLNQEQAEFLKWADGPIRIIGGYSAVNAAVEDELHAYSQDVQRLAGTDRHSTSVLVARTFFPKATGAVLAYSRNFPDGLCGGPLAHSLNAPLILTVSGDPTPEGYLAANGIRSGYVLGTGELIDDASVRRLFRLDADAQIPAK